MNKKLHGIHHWLWSIVMDTWKQMNQAQLLLVASSLAYTTILSLIPLLAVSFAIFKAFGGMEKLYQTIEPVILANLAEGTSEEVIQRIHGLIDNAHASAVGLGGFFGLLFTSMSMLSSIEKAINRVWQTTFNRGWFERISTYWLFITLGPLTAAALLGFATSSDYPLSSMLPSGAGIFISTIVVFFCVYKWVPHAKVKWQYALTSAIFTSIVWNLARMGYALYTRKVVTYSKIYGSLGAIPILLLWIYIIWVIILTGAALTATLQKRLPQIVEKAP